MTVSTCEAIEKTVLSLKIHRKMFFSKGNQYNYTYKREFMKNILKKTGLVKSINIKLYNVEYVTKKTIPAGDSTGLSDTTLLQSFRRSSGPIWNYNASIKIASVPTKMATGRLSNI